MKWSKRPKVTVTSGSAQLSGLMACPSMLNCTAHGAEMCRDVGERKTHIQENDDCCRVSCCEPARGLIQGRRERDCGDEGV